MNFKRYLLLLSLAVLGLCVNNTIASAAYLNFGLTKTDVNQKRDNSGNTYLNFGLTKIDLNQEGEPIQVETSQDPVAQTPSQNIEIPEPATISMFSLGILGLAASRRRLRHN
jgi:hypothetical protein